MTRILVDPKRLAFDSPRTALALVVARAPAPLTRRHARRWPWLVALALAVLYLL